MINNSTQAFSPTLEDFHTKLFAVHATDVFPQDGVIKAGAIIEHQGTPQSADTRNTVHFSLGLLVASHETSWDMSKFAVISRIEPLLARMINLDPYDTYLLNDFKLSEKSILVVPNDYSLTQDLSCCVVRYTADQKIKEVIADIISTLGGWSIQLNSGEATIKADATIEGSREEVMTPLFFKSLLESNPHLSFGFHNAKIRGEAWRTGAIENLLLQLSLTYLYSTGCSRLIFTDDMVKYIKNVLQHHYTKIQDLAHSPELKDFQREHYQQLLHTVAAFKYILTLDDTLRSGFVMDKSIFHSRSLIEHPNQVLRKWVNDKMALMKSEPVSITKIADDSDLASLIPITSVSNTYHFMMSTFSYNCMTNRKVFAYVHDLPLNEYFEFVRSNPQEKNEVVSFMKHVLAWYNGEITQDDFKLVFDVNNLNPDFLSNLNRREPCKSPLEVLLEFYALPAKSIVSQSFKERAAEIASLLVPINEPVSPY